MDDMIVHIRAEAEADHAAIYNVNHQAFGGPGEAELVEAIRNSPGFIPALSLVAEVDGRVVGHILFSLVSLARENDQIPLLCLAPMAVLPECQRQGIGSQLVRRGLDAARQLGYGVVNVLGHPEFYPRFDFQPARRHGMLPPFDVPDEAWMVVELVPGSLADCQGMVRYPHIFDGV